MPLEWSTIRQSRRQELGRERNTDLTDAAHACNRFTDCAHNQKGVQNGVLAYF